MKKLFRPITIIAAIIAIAFAAGYLIDKTATTLFAQQNTRNPIQTNTKTNTNTTKRNNKMSVYDFSVKNTKGTATPLSDFRGKVLLIVNTATKCGLTPQYEALETLYKKYKDKGLEILDFPCNQFLEQAPGTDEEIAQFCTLNYGTTFPRFAKIEVNGKNAAPLYVWLKEQAPADKGNEKTKEFEQKVKSFTQNNEDFDIKWNFGKFLIDKQGNVFARYSPAFEPKLLEAEIEKLLAK